MGSEPNVRACLRPLEEGLEVRPQNAWPSLKLDVMALTEWVSRFLPAGFYYKTFIRPRRLWPLYDRVLRTAAGLGTVDEQTPEGEHDKQYLHADVVVAGGGPAGMSAALAARESGARVLLMDENPALGGHLRFSGAAPQGHLDAAAERLSQAGVEVITGTSVTGWYQDHWLSAVRGHRLFKIRARAVVVATGSHEIPPLFVGNDRPGVMLGTAVQRLLRLYGVAPGRRAVVVTAGDGGWEVAADLLAAGVEVAAVADERQGVEPPGAEALAASGAELLTGYTIGAARGGSRVREAVLVPASGTGSRRQVRCDLVAVSTGRQPSAELAWMAGASSRYDEGQLRDAGGGPPGRRVPRGAGRRPAGPGRGRGGARPPGGRRRGRPRPGSGPREGRGGRPGPGGQPEGPPPGIRPAGRPPAPPPWSALPPAAAASASSACART